MTATYSHFSFDMPPIAQAFSGRLTYAFDSLSSNLGMLVYTYANQDNPGDTGTIRVFGTFVSFNGFGEAIANAITGYERRDATGVFIIDQLTDFDRVSDTGFLFSMGRSTGDFFSSGGEVYKGSAFKDIMSGGEGGDLMFGDGDDDNISGNNGSDTIHGGGGNDSLSGGDDGDTEANSVYGDAGNDSIVGAKGSDKLFGGSGLDVISGREGDDIINGGTGADVMVGGLGNDTYYFDNAGDKIQEDVQQLNVNDTVYAYVSCDLQGIGATFIETLSGKFAKSGVILAGSTSTVSITGGSFNDTLVGRAANETLNGGAGNDTMTGFIFDDTYIVDSAGDVVIDEGNPNTAPDGGNDTVKAYVSYTLGSGQRIETLMAATGVSGVALTGNEFDNAILGSNGADTLSGGDGADVLKGKNGADRLDGGLKLDVLFGGDGADVFVLQKSGASRDFIRDFTAGTDKLEVSEALFGELNGDIAFADRFLANDGGVISNGGSADTRFVYDTATGQLIFDSDGTGVANGRVIATLTTHPDLAADDFLII